MTTEWPHKDFPQSVSLPALGHLPPHRHLFEAREVWALRAALGARRPLLVRGEPGTGKSELARAAAEALERSLVSEVISARTEPADLHYRFDAVARLGQAQLLGVKREGAAERDLEDLREELFVEPGPLWWVFDWESAEAQYEKASVKGKRPERRPSWEAKRGTVLLIDEIDKADPDLPNGLLESLGNGQFAVPYLNQSVRCSVEREPPLVVITTNEERELPPAFVRRCLVLRLALKKGEELRSWLVARGQAHFGAGIPDTVYQKAAQLLVADREALGDEELVRPGQAEYLDLLRAVADVAKGDFDLQAAVLEDVAGFALRKNATT